MFSCFNFKNLFLPLKAEYFENVAKSTRTQACTLYFLDLLNSTIEWYLYK